MSMNYQEVMAILEDEHSKELKDASKAWENAYKTLSPIKRIKYRKEYFSHLGHASGINQTIRRIKDKEEA